MSRDVLELSDEPEPFTLFRAPLNVLIISGKDFMRLIIPPAAKAPAPMYLIYVDHIAEAPPDAYNRYIPCAAPDTKVFRLPNRYHPLFYFEHPNPMIVRYGE